MWKLLTQPEVWLRQDELSEQLSPAIDVDGKRTVDGVMEALLCGDFALFEINMKSVNVLMVVEIGHTPENAKCLWIIYLAGRIGLGPKAWLAGVRSHVSLLMGVAKSMNCTEMRLEGRNWSRVLPWWERLNGNELRQML